MTEIESEQPQNDPPTAKKGGSGVKKEELEEVTTYSDGMTQYNVGGRFCFCFCLHLFFIVYQVDGISDGRGCLFIPQFLPILRIQYCFANMFEQLNCCCIFIPT